jgi:hypothetical protein
MNVYPGARYRLLKNLTAIDHDADARQKLVTLPAETLLTVAAVVQGSLFIQVVCGTATYDVSKEDLQDAAQPLSSE